MHDETRKGCRPWGHLGPLIAIITVSPTYVYVVRPPLFQREATPPQKARKCPLSQSEQQGSFCRQKGLAISDLRTDLPIQPSERPTQQGAPVVMSGVLKRPVQYMWIAYFGADLGDALSTVLLAPADSLLCNADDGDNCKQLNVTHLYVYCPLRRPLG